MGSPSSLPGWLARATFPTIFSNWPRPGTGEVSENSAVNATGRVLGVPGGREQTFAGAAGPRADKKPGRGTRRKEFREPKSKSGLRTRVERPRGKLLLNLDR